MINKDIIRLASNTSNVGLKNKYSHKISLKNSTCGDKITLELIADKKKISSMKYETVSCVYCEASASLVSRKIKNIKLNNNEYLFHAGTKHENGNYLAIGGRVLNIIATTKNFKESREKVFKILENLDWNDGFFRKDIAHKVI